VQSVLNSSPLARLGNRCALTAFTGLPQDSPLLSIKEGDLKPIKIRSLSDIRAKQLIGVIRMQKAIGDMHKEVSRSVSDRRRKEVQRHNARTHVRPINFSQGDFVLRGVLRKEKGGKASVKWRGPFRVVACRSEYIFLIKDLLSGNELEVHGRRLKFFRNKDFEVTEEVRNHLAYQENELLVVRSFEDIRANAGTVELLVHWRGFEKDESSWEPLDLMREDVPVLVREFIEMMNKSGTTGQRKVAAAL